VSDRENADPASNLFEAELGRQILVSERERASLQAVIGIGLLPIGVVNAVYIVTASPLPAIKAALLMVVTIIIYELAVRQLFDRSLRQDRRLPPAIRYVNVAIETSFPTVLLA
jgi:hypothetical protein